MQLKAYATLASASQLSCPISVSSDVPDEQAARLNGTVTIIGRGARHLHIFRLPQQISHCSPVRLPCRGGGVAKVRGKCGKIDKKFRHLAQIGRCMCMLMMPSTLPSGQVWSPRRPRLTFWLSPRAKGDWNPSRIIIGPSLICRLATTLHRCCRSKF